jgi:hypothetical protein
MGDQPKTEDNVPDIAISGTIHDNFHVSSFSAIADSLLK